MITSKNFVEQLSILKNHTPIADSFGDRKNLEKEYPGENQHEVQKNHIFSWFNAKDSECAEKVYDNLKDPAMIIWIAERVGVDEESIKVAASVAGDEYKSPKFAEEYGKNGTLLEGSPLVVKQTEIVRGKLPWNMIESKIITE